MATIRAFHALRPEPFYAERLVFPANRQTHFFNIDEGELPLRPLKEQLETPARQRPETDKGQQAAYRAIRKNLEMLKLLGRVNLEERPGIYVYELEEPAYRQTGIWTLTSVRDLAGGKIKLHEGTLADSERRIHNYRENTGLEGSPILLTYPPDATIESIIAATCAAARPTVISNNRCKHKLWKIEEPGAIDALVEAFRQIDIAYLADGHHRLAAATKKNEATFISSLYMAADQLRIGEYHRAVIPEAPVNSPQLLKQLADSCEVWPRSDGNILKPSSKGIIGMCLQGQWYELLLKDRQQLDVVTLQEQILAPFFGITDPRKDSRLKHIGGASAMEEIAALVEAEPAAIVFTLCPMTPGELIRAAANDQLLPPKSTWIEPKVPYGLLMYQPKDQDDE